MSQALDYAPPSRPYRRYALILLTLSALGLSYALAVPRFKKFRHDQIRRQEIRRQFNEQLELARRAIENNRGTDAALALLRAEFPTQTERHLFRESQAKAFQRRIDELRAHLNTAVECEECSRESEMPMAVVEEFTRLLKGSSSTLPDETSSSAEERSQAATKQLEAATMSISNCSFDSAESLRQGAITLLRSGNYQQALAACERLVRSYPRSQFDVDFWANARATR